MKPKAPHNLNFTVQIFLSPPKTPPKSVSLPPPTPPRRRISANQMNSKKPLQSNGNETAIDEKKLEQEKNREVARQIAAIKAISDAEVEDLLTELHLIRSYFTEEQLTTPVLQFFEENLPNVSVIRGGENGEQFDLRWKDGDGYNCNAGGRDFHTSLLHQIAMAYPSRTDARQSFGGFQFSAKSMMTDLPHVDDLQFGTYLSQESLNNVMFGMPEGFQTPGATSQRMSVGMTPKTLRLPKQGEMLLSVHGSPLGVYKEDNMEAINEAEEG